MIMVSNGQVARIMGKSVFYKLIRFLIAELRISTSYLQSNGVKDEEIKAAIANPGTCAPVRKRPNRWLKV